MRKALIAFAMLMLSGWTFGAVCSDGPGSNCCAWDAGLEEWVCTQALQSRNDGTGGDDAPECSWVKLDSRCDTSDRNLCFLHLTRCCCGIAEDPPSPYTRCVSCEGSMGAESGSLQQKAIRSGSFTIKYLIGQTWHTSTITRQDDGTWTSQRGTLYYGDPLVGFSMLPPEGGLDDPGTQQDECRRRGEDGECLERTR